MKALIYFTGVFIIFIYACFLACILNLIVASAYYFERGVFSISLNDIYWNLKFSVLIAILFSSI